jgi:hypothetical protein
MYRQVNGLFMRLAGALLLFTGLAKVLSADGDTMILLQADPIFGVSIKSLLYAAGALECVVGCVCLFSGSNIVSLKILSWLTANLVTYRLGLVAMGYRKPCECLGNLTGRLHLSLSGSNMLMTAVLVYLCITCISNYIQHRRAAMMNPPAATGA